MAKYMFIYHGGDMPATQEEGEKVMAAWDHWFAQMGPVVVERGNPVGMSTTVFSDRVEDNGGTNPTSGYSIIEARNLEKAIAMAKACPIHETGGSVEIAEVIKVKQSVVWD